MKLYRYYEDNFPTGRMEFIVCAADKEEAKLTVIKYLTNSKEYDIQYFPIEDIEQYISDYIPQKSQVLADVSWANDLKGHFDT